MTATATKGFPGKRLFAVALAIATLVAPQVVPAAPSTVSRAVSGGCGTGRTRDAGGHCRHRFNLFDHHERRRFHRFRAKHCTTIRTANGPVRRCRV